MHSIKSSEGRRLKLVCLHFLFLVIDCGKQYIVTTVSNFLALGLYIVLSRICVTISLSSAFSKSY